MFGIKKINKNTAEQNVFNFQSIANAYADQQDKIGETVGKKISAANAKEVYKKLVKMVSAFANTESKDHNMAYNALKSSFNGKMQDEVLADIHTMGSEFLNKTMTLVQHYTKAGMGSEQAVESAMNSLAGNPVYDQFLNIANLSGQLYEDQTFMETFSEYGDSFNVPLESGSTGTAGSRFRIPTEMVTGSAKRYQGDINPGSREQIDATRIQVNLLSEFKDAITEYAAFVIDQDMRNQALGYQKSIDPALAGFVLQNRYAPAAQKQVFKLCEAMFVDGQAANASYTPNVGGNYGILSSNIRLQLSDWDAAAPAPANSADWASNPTKLIQVIENFYAKPASVTAQLPASLDPTLVYKDIIRMLSLPAINNVDFKQRNWVLYVPSSFFALATQYPSSGTFNLNLLTMIKEMGMGKIINSVEVRPSSLLNYRATNLYGETASAYNYFLAVAQGCAQEYKPIIMPGQVAAPIMTTTNVSANRMEFELQFPFGGPMVAQFGGAVLLQFSEAAA